MSNVEVEVKLNSSGIRDLLKSDGIKAVLNEQAKAIASEAGHCKVTQGEFAERAKVCVRQKVSEEDMEQNTLLKAVHMK